MTICVSILATTLTVFATDTQVFSVVSSNFWLHTKESVNEECSMIVGEIRNNSKFPQKDITITSYEVKGKEKIRNFFGFTDISILNPGEKAPYVVPIFPKKCFKYKLEIESKRSEVLGDRSLIIISKHTGVSGKISFEISGKLKNSSTYPVKKAEIVCGSFSDENRKNFWGSSNDFPKWGATIQPGEVVDFRLIILDPKQVSRSFTCLTQVERI
jgi:hypothetical protein